MENEELQLKPKTNIRMIPTVENPKAFQMLIIIYFLLMILSRIVSNQPFVNGLTVLGTLIETLFNLLLSGFFFISFFQTKYKSLPIWGMVVFFGFQILGCIVAFANSLQQIDLWDFTNVLFVLIMYILPFTAYVTSFLWIFRIVKTKWIYRLALSLLGTARVLLFSNLFFMGTSYSSYLELIIPLFPLIFFGLAFLSCSGIAKKKWISVLAIFFFGISVLYPLSLLLIFGESSSSAILFDALLYILRQLFIVLILLLFMRDVSYLEVARSGSNTDDSAEYSAVAPVNGESGTNIAVENKGKYSKSTFTGSTFGLVGIRFLSYLITLVTLGIGFPFALCLQKRWSISHTYIDGEQLVFDGNGTQLFGKFIVWYLLSIVTAGIYLFFLPIKMEKWVTSHTHHLKR